MFKVDKMQIGKNEFDFWRMTIDFLAADGFFRFFKNEKRKGNLFFINSLE